MGGHVLAIGAKAMMTRDGLQALIEALLLRGYHVIGPRLGEGAIVYDDIGGIAELPAGWTDRQEAGSYRLERRTDGALFGYAVGPQSWKRFLHPPVERLWQARRKGDEIAILPAEIEPPKFAFLGVRACELHAIQIQDRVFTAGPHIDVAYGARRHDNFIVAVNCGTAGGTCFCVSMASGPKVNGGFDLALTEMIENGAHEFLVEIGSAAGAELFAGIPQRSASGDDIAAADAVVARTAHEMGRTLDTTGIKELLQGNPNHPRWGAVASRCLTCANCTMVCPTCFCTTVEDGSDLADGMAARVRKWDSCFTLDFSFVHGGPVRSEPRSRYRQWMTHKLANWIDQFGESGCVGCGRCITWCPVGIDITEEVAAIRASAGTAGKSENGGA